MIYRASDSSKTTLESVKFAEMFLVASVVKEFFASFVPSVLNKELLCQRK